MKFEILTGVILLQILRSTTFMLIIFLEISTEIWKKLILMFFWPKKWGFFNFSNRRFQILPNMMYALVMWRMSFFTHPRMRMRMRIWDFDIRGCGSLVSYCLVTYRYIVPPLTPVPSRKEVKVIILGTGYEPFLVNRLIWVLFNRFNFQWAFDFGYIPSWRFQKAPAPFPLVVTMGVSSWT